MKACIYVGLGGCIGAVLRYLLSSIPVKGNFPVMTFLINIAGAFLIGIVVGLMGRYPELPQWVPLAVKTGVCGGFTTFSTFSLETFNLFEKKAYVTGASYAVLSVVLCLLGVWLGQMTVKNIA